MACKSKRLLHGPVVMPRLEVKPLSDSKVTQAFALIQLEIPHLPLQDWYDFASERMAPAPSRECGILTVEDQHGYILGLLDYVIDVDLTCGRVLLARHFIAPHAFHKGRQAVVSALLDTVEALAQQRGCRVIQFQVSPPRRGSWRSPLIELLESKGHRRGQVSLWKALEPSP